MFVTSSIPAELGYGSVQVFRLRQNCVLENGLISHKCIHGGYALDRGIQVLKKLVRNPGRDFCSVSPAQHIFVGDDDPAGLLYRGRNRVPVVRVEGTQIDKLDLPSQFTARLLGSTQGTRHYGAVGNERNVVALP